MTEKKKAVKDGHAVAEKNEKTINPSYVTNPIAHAHILDIETRVSTPSEKDLVDVKKYGEKNQQ